MSSTRLRAQAYSSGSKHAYIQLTLSINYSAAIDLKKTEALATGHKDFEKWCMKTDPENSATNPECKKTDWCVLFSFHCTCVSKHTYLRRPSSLAYMQGSMRAFAQDRVFR